MEMESVGSWLLKCTMTPLSQGYWLELNQIGRLKCSEPQLLSVIGRSFKVDLRTQTHGHFDAGFPDVTISCVCKGRAIFSNCSKCLHNWSNMTDWQWYLMTRSQETPRNGLPCWIVQSITPTRTKQYRRTCPICKGSQWWWIDLLMPIMRVVNWHFGHILVLSLYQLCSNHLVLKVTEYSGIFHVWLGVYPHGVCSWVDWPVAVQVKDDGFSGWASSTM